MFAAAANVGPCRGRIHDAARGPDQTRGLEPRKSTFVRRLIGHYSVRHFQANQFAYGLERPSVIRSFSRRSIASSRSLPAARATAEHPDWMSIVPVSIHASPTLSCGNSHDRTPGSPAVRAELRPAIRAVQRVCIRRPRVTDRHVQSREQGTSCSPATRGPSDRRRPEKELQLARRVPPARLVADVDGVRGAEVPAHYDEVGVGRRRRVLADAVSVVEVDVRQVAAAGGIDVPAVVTKIGAPDVAVLPAGDGGMAGEQVPSCERTSLRNRQRQIRTTTPRHIGLHGPSGETHSPYPVPCARQQGECGNSPTIPCIPGLSAITDALSNPLRQLSSSRPSL